MKAHAHARAMPTNNSICKSSKKRRAINAAYKEHEPACPQKRADRGMRCAHSYGRTVGRDEKSRKKGGGYISKRWRIMR